MIEEFASSQRVRAEEIPEPCVFDPDRTPAMSRLSMNQMTTCRWSFAEDVNGYVESGISAIGIWRPKLVQFGEERGIDLIHESGLSVSSVSWAGGFTGAYGHSYAESMHDARDAMATAAALNADCLRLVSGGRAGHTLNHARRLLVAALKDLADTAGDYGITLAIQPMHPMFARDWTFLNSLEETCSLIDQCDHPCLQMAFGLYHLWQEPRLLEMIPDLVPMVSTIQLSDWREPPRSENDRLLIGDGTIPISDIVHSFVESGYAGFFEIEVWSEELWMSDYLHLLQESRLRFDRLCRVP